MFLSCTKYFLDTSTNIGLTLYPQGKPTARLGREQGDAGHRMRGMVAGGGKPAGGIHPKSDEPEANASAGRV